MHKLSDNEKKKRDAMQAFLSRYAVADESRKSISQLSTQSDYARRQSERAWAIMSEIESAISRLDVSRGKTIVEKKHIAGLDWRRISMSMNLCRDTCFELYCKALIELYDLIMEE